MSWYYTHLLIPVDADFVPQSQQVVAFLRGLTQLGSIPLEPTFELSTPAHSVRTSPIAPMPRRSWFTLSGIFALSGITEVGAKLAVLNDYCVAVKGQGPPPVPPFRLHQIGAAEMPECEGIYHYEVHCTLRKQPTSTSFETFGLPCAAGSRTGIFRNPLTDAVIETPDAGCARF